MSNKIIRKALDELNKENPKLDYIRGMLEVLVDDEPVKPVEKVEFKPAKLNPNPNPHGLPEGMLDASKVLNG